MTYTGAGIMTALVKFLLSPMGRVTRILIGATLLSVGLITLYTNATVGVLLFAAGLIPLAEGLLDWCVFAPLVGASFAGEKARKRLHVR